MDGEMCFVCCGGLTSIVNGKNNWRTRTSGSSSTLENNFNVIFILRNLLQVPIVDLERQLQACGENPEDWISLCDPCIQLTDKARELHQEIKKIERQLKLIEKQVLEKITSSVVTDDDDDEEVEGTYHHGNSSKFRRNIRLIAKQNNRHWVNDEEDGHHNAFREGDKLARILASKQNPSTAQILLLEKCEVIPNEEIKLEIERPPSPASPAMSQSAEEEYQVTPSSSFSNDDDDDDEDEEKPSIKPKRKSKPRPGRKRTPKLKLGPFKCRHCEEQFPDELTLKNHVTLVHGTKKVKYVLCKCPHCEKQFTARKTLHDHVSYVHLKAFTISCPICEKGFPYNRQKYEHMLMHHKDEPATLKLQEEKKIFLNRCPVGCRTVCLNKDELDKHMERKHGIDKDPKVPRKSKITEDEKFECGQCGKIVYSPKYWSDHMWKSHNVEEVTCPVEECGVVITQKGYEFRDHWNLAHKKKRENDGRPQGPFICDICGVSMSQRHTFYHHRRRVHQVGANGEPVKVKREEEPILCSLCGKGFSGKDGLNQHMRYVHEKRFSLSCHVCGLRVISRQRLNMHLLGVHRDDPVAKQLEEVEGLKLRKCEVVGCRATYLREEKLDKHMEKMHKGEGDKEGRFKCKVCRKGFWVRASLKTHESSHGKPGARLKEGDFNFRCGDCGKGFNVKRCLRQHEIHVHNSAKLK